MHLGRQDVVGTAALGTIWPHTVLLVEATSTAVLSAYPEREEALVRGVRVLDRRIRQGRRHSRPRNLFRDVEAAKFGGLGGDVCVGARQHVRVADDMATQLRDEDGRAGGKFGEPFGEVGGSLLHREGVQVRLAKKSR